MVLDFLMSDDGRIVTSAYEKGGRSRFCLSERIHSGTLISEFSYGAEILNQVYLGNTDHENNLSDYLALKERRVVLVGGYRGIRANAKCSSCSGMGLQRALDFSNPSEIKEVPVVPLFKCVSCGKMHYSMTDEYLKRMMQDKAELFEPEELAEVKNGGEASVKTLQEYIIRIFASKKISRFKIE